MTEHGVTHKASPTGCGQLAGWGGNLPSSELEGLGKRRGIPEGK